MQALDYVEELPRLEQPRLVVTCNFETFRVYDRDAWAKSQLIDHPFEFTLAELVDHPEYLSFITDPANNVLCVRLVFCLFCEDADLFPKDVFLHYLKDVSPENIRISLKRLFKALDTPYSQRDPYDTTLKPFPYVNGGLFREQSEVPNFDAEMKRFLLEEVSAPVDWSQISPTIFGGIFESTLNPETRRDHVLRLLVIAGCGGQERHIRHQLGSSE